MSAIVNLGYRASRRFAYSIRSPCSYKEFTHKGNFKPLDQEMSELQSKKGYSEKAFYNIQNRQQQLADKILGLRYRLTCPPLQLTGPAASEKRKTASRQNKSHNPRI